ncbi:hypothetical protein [Palleronia caenipelagi]|uniref:Tetratricopeptide repeat protein n=1 Tax=Palleronia caenipelagi TaxID=2489174 RepID=A0A547PW30_9RHOB|nr:hypothetical protein [Palleronia caenipelagi]TRD18359.1 hypothetical protein FEV53_11935 [Palleronia caenipelagi]
MNEYPFNVEELSDAAQTLLAENDSAQSYRLAVQIRDDIKAGPNPNYLVALAWTLTEIVESGVFIDDLWIDIQEAQEALTAAVVLNPELMRVDSFVAQQKRTSSVYDRVCKFEKAEQARLRKIKSKSDSEFNAKQAADIAYKSSDPSEIAHYFLLAAQKTEPTNREQVEWYLNSRTHALLDLRRWDEAEPQLKRMVKGNTSVDFWIEQGFVGLLRIAAAKSDVRNFKKIWMQARSARSAIPGLTPGYYKVLRFGVENDIFDFVDPVYKKLIENKTYKKSREDQELLVLADNYIRQKSSQTSDGNLRSLFRFFKS